MTKNQEKTINAISEAAAALGFYRFEDKSYRADYSAERNLQGKTHYVDADTMRFFSARTLCARALSPLYFIILQSQKSGPGSAAGRVRRVTVFDVFGEVVEQSDDIANAAKADQAYYALCDKWSAPAFAIREAKKSTPSKTYAHACNA